MGVDVRAMTYIGVYVVDVEEYFVSKGIVTQEQWDGDLMDELNPPIEAQAVSYYSDEGYYVGWEVGPSDYKIFDSLIAEFKEITGDEAGVHQFVQWH